MTTTGVAAEDRFDGEPGDDDGRDDRQPGVHQCTQACGCLGPPAEGHQDRLRRRRRVQRSPAHLGRARQGDGQAPGHGASPWRHAARRREDRGLLGGCAQGLPGRLQTGLDTSPEGGAVLKRNDQLLEAMPIGVVVFPGSGVTNNLADKAKAMGIPLFDCRKAGGA
jgi:hypothetical protein